MHTDLKAFNFIRLVFVTFGGVMLLAGTFAAIPLLWLTFVRVQRFWLFLEFFPVASATCARGIFKRLGGGGPFRWIFGYDAGVQVIIEFHARPSITIFLTAFGTREHARLNHTRFIFYLSHGRIQHLLTFVPQVRFYLQLTQFNQSVVNRRKCESNHFRMSDYE